MLKAFVHGDGNLFSIYPELEEALVWVYFHSNLPEFNRVECWGPLKEAAAPSSGAREEFEKKEIPQPCQHECSCCFPPMSSIPWPQHIPTDISDETDRSLAQQQQV